MLNKDKKICVIGLGFMGLPTACYLASSGYYVVGIDIDEQKLELLKNKQLSFEEPGLEDLFKKAYPNLIFDSRPQPADVFIICVPTPLTEQYTSDLSYVIAATKSISNVIKDSDLIIVESTIPPGCNKQIIWPLLNHKNISLAYVPERAIPGKTLEEMKNNNRIIGGIDQISAKKAKEIYSSFVEGDIHLTNIATAEAVKLLENSYRDINIAFANELAKTCHHLGINVWEVIKLCNQHPRVNILKPGPGVGGHCIPVDPWFLVGQTEYGSQFIKLTRQINDSMPSYVVEQIRSIFGNDQQNKTITLLGVAYKANVDDWRETPALKVIEEIKKLGWNVKLHDPFVKNFSHPLTRNLQEATQDSDCLVIITDHDMYKEINPQDIQNMRNKNIFDARNIIDKEKWQTAGFNIKTLGSNETLIHKDKSLPMQG